MRNKSSIYHVIMSEYVLQTPGFHCTSSVTYACHNRTLNSQDSYLSLGRLGYEMGGCRYTKKCRDNSTKKFHGQSRFIIVN